MRAPLLAALSVCLAPLAMAAPPDPATLRFPSPVPARCYSSPFGWRHYVGPQAPAGFHNGIDIPAPAGAEVRAVAAGTVTRIRRIGIGGLNVEERLPGGLVVLYAHLGDVSPALATGGTSLRAGESIGRVGRTGVSYGTHVFLAVFADGHAIDPNRFLGLPPC